MTADSHQSDLVRWREESLGDLDGCCKEIAVLDGKLREDIKASGVMVKKYFAEELKKDSPTGETPGEIWQSRINLE